MRTSLLAVITIVLLLVGSAELIQAGSLGKFSVYRDAGTNADDAATFRNVAADGCADKCIQHPWCRSFHVDDETRICTLHVESVACGDDVPVISKLRGANVDYYELARRYVEPSGYIRVPHATLQATAFQMLEDTSVEKCAEICSAYSLDALKARKQKREESKRKLDERRKENVGAKEFDADYWEESNLYADDHSKMRVCTSFSYLRHEGGCELFSATTTGRLLQTGLKGRAMRDYYEAASSHSPNAKRTGNTHIPANAIARSAHRVRQHTAHYETIETAATSMNECSKQCITRADPHNMCMSFFYDRRRNRCRLEMKKATKLHRPETEEEMLTGNNAKERETRPTQREQVVDNNGNEVPPLPEEHPSLLLIGDQRST